MAAQGLAAAPPGHRPAWRTALWRRARTLTARTAVHGRPRWIDGMIRDASASYLHGDPPGPGSATALADRPLRKP